MGDLYPDMPPALPGETDDQYTDRLTGADGTGRVPYDHVRNRQCSIGYHHECSERGAAADGRRCRCPCHSEADQPRDPTAGVAMHIGATRPQDPAADTGAPGSALDRQARIADALRRADFMNWSAAENAERIDGTVSAIEAEARAAGDAEVRRLREAIRAVLEDAESQHPGGWGPDVTTVAFLHAALAASQPSAAAAQGPIDVGRLAEALNATVGTYGWLRSTPGNPSAEWLANAEHVAAEYDRLAARPDPDPAGAPE